MIDTLKHVKSELEQALANPSDHNLDHCVNELLKAKTNDGEHKKMMDDIVNSVTHVMHAQPRLREYGTNISSNNAFKEAYNAVDQAIDTLSH
ncbi:hypothetical protein D3H55_09010 [Bacillus salacetis]|uniref:Uncharacterized protein n=1 Tax=Bacillus salacetis TaxID=2315464 RepID=A0A3A1R329_9BACI|nr:hypothetical protein [Bacillus salacetis]RIW34644.1 hypothetical protein D3H55_09010 [Bacillus salacetis]